jgi:hypothetical protein
MSGIVRFDGLYVDQGNEYATYLRFSPGNRVSRVSSSGNPSEVFAWLTADNPNCAQGTYEVFGIAINYTVPMPQLGPTTFQAQVIDLNSGPVLAVLSPWAERYVFTPLAGPSTAPGTPVASEDRKHSRTRFSATGMRSERLTVGPHMTKADGSTWVVINVSVSDGTRTVSVDFPLSLAHELLAEMQTIVSEMEDAKGTVPSTWDLSVTS